MSRPTEHVSPAVSPHQRHDALIRRYDEVYELWSRQQSLVSAMCAGTPAGGGSDPERAARLREQTEIASALRARLDGLRTAIDRCEAAAVSRRRRTQAGRRH